MPGEPADTVAPGAPLPATLTLPGGAGCSATALYQDAPAPGQTVLTVGQGEAYQTIAAAIAASANGDLILVQPGTYTNDFADITKQVTISGAGGLVNMVETEAPPSEKGFFVVDSSVQIDNFVFQGCAIASAEGGNGAGIRYQGGAMVLHNDAFIANQNGILAAAVDSLPVNTIAISGCTFDNNGNATGPQAGYTHNLYVSTGVTTLTATGNIFERANVGHEFKSRAEANIITGNIFYDGPTGTASYSIDLPDGGADTISGNLIEKGPHAENNAVIHFGGEGIPYANSTLSITGNTIINDLGPAAIGLLNQTTLQASITGNRLDYFEHATIGQGVFVESGNVDENGNAIAPTASSNFAPGTNLDDFSHDSNPHSVTLTTKTGVLGGGGLVCVYADAGHVTVVGGAGGLNYQEAPGFGGSAITTALGANDTVVAPGQDTIASNGNDSITLGSGNASVQVDGVARIAAGSGNSAFAVNGAASITGGGGADTVQVNAAAASVSLSGTMSYLQLTVVGGNAGLSIAQGSTLEQATIAGGSAAAKLYNGQLNVTTSGAGAGAAISFGSGTDLLMSEGADTIHAGSGAETVIVCASSQVTAGSGTLSVYGRSESGHASVYAAGGSVYLGGDTGDITYFGSAASNTVTSALSNDTFLGGAGVMSITGGGDSEAVVGGSGGIYFSTTGGNDRIATQQGAHDTLNFAGACVVTSNGTDVINAGWGNSSIAVNGRATITGSTGNAQYTLNGADSLAAYGGSNVTVGAGAADTVAAYGALTKVAVSAGGTLVFSHAGAADLETATVTGAGATALAFSSSTITTLTLAGSGDGATLGQGQFAVAAQAGAQIWAGTGQASVTLWQGGGAVHGGTGALTVSVSDWLDQTPTTIFGGAGALTAARGFGNVLFLGGTGTATLGGTSGSETIMAGAGNITLQGGAAGTSFTAGSGSACATLTTGGATVTLGSGASAITEASWGKADIYLFNAGTGGGADTISGFRPGTDSLVFNGVSVSTTAALGNATLLTLSDGTHVTLIGVSSLSLGLH